MGDRTNIEWADATITPIRFRVTALGERQLAVEGRTRIGEGRGIGWHCVHVSEGCRNCYAEAMNRWRGTGFAFTPESLRLGWIEPFLDERHLLKPLHMRRPRRIFWNDMTDLFGDWVPDEWIERHFTVFALTPKHTHIILTKRAERMREYLGDPEAPRRIALAASRMQNAVTPADSLPMWPLPNVWGLVSVEDQARADKRLPPLIDAPLAVRGVSYEPAIGPVDLSGFLCDNPSHEHYQTRRGVDLRDGASRRDGDRRSGSNMADRQAGLGSLEQGRSDKPLREDQGGEEAAFGISDGPRHDWQASSERSSTSSRLATFQRSVAGRNDDQPSERDQIRQPPGQSRTGDTIRERTARRPDIRGWQDRVSMGHSESCGQVDIRSSDGDSGAAGERRKITHLGSGIRSGISDNLACRPRGSPPFWVICGGESGPGARPFDLAWARDVIAQCRAAGVPVFVKQLGTKLFLNHPKGGDPAEWPEDLRVREFTTSRAT